MNSASDDLVTVTPLSAAMAHIGEPAPSFDLPCTDRTGRVFQTRLEDYAGSWLIVIFYPRDFSFVCPTELTAFSARNSDFAERNCRLLGISADPVELHQEWLTTPAEAGGLGPLQFALASDGGGTMARAYGVWNAKKQVTNRGLFLIDPQGVLQYAALHNLNVGRSTAETLRVLTALQTGGLCPASWTRADGTLDPESMLQPGRILGHYRIRRLLGRGSFATVFAAWDLRLERMVALKVLHRNVGTSRNAVLAEARSAAKLNHPNVCTIYAVDEEEGLPVIVMEYLEGQPLSHVIRDGLPHEMARPLARQIALALEAAHNTGLVHGDLKPANVFVSPAHVAKILDFGLARLLRRKEREKRREAGPSPLVPEPVILDLQATVDYVPSGNAEACLCEPESSAVESSSLSGGNGLTGTPAYMSPEQASGRLSEPASDVFSFGLLLYEMLTGERALKENVLLPLLQRLRNEELAPALVPKVSQGYRELLHQTLSIDPTRRPTMTRIVETLEA